MFSIFLLEIYIAVCQVLAMVCITVSSVLTLQKMFNLKKKNRKGTREKKSGSLRTSGISVTLRRSLTL